MGGLAARLAVVGLALVLVMGGVAADTPDRNGQAVSTATTNFSRAEPLEALSGGTATNRKRFGHDAFSEPAASMSFDKRRDFFLGNGLFRTRWVAAPGAVGSADGLGPLYNAQGCQRCHLKDGRGHPPDDPENGAVSMILRLSIPPQSDEQRRRLAERRVLSIPEPTYGEQLQDLAIAGQRPEGRVLLTYRARSMELDDGTSVQLRTPHYTVAGPAYGAMHPATMLSPRVAPAMIGLGLLEAIAAQDIIAAADPDDADSDGVSGKANLVWSDQQQRVMLGRFGWKAAKATIVDQSAAAFFTDLGISSPLATNHWGDCSEAQSECRAGPHGGDGHALEVSGDSLDKVVFYSRHLAVPERRNVDDSKVLRGKALFYASGCIACHTPKHRTRADWPLPALAAQLIWPYTDLLLHDLGEELSDGRPEGEASGREWRTPPLWGIGLSETVSGHTYFLHDGRARNLMEAILWHAGEALASRDAVRRMKAADRQLLLDFLNSL